MARTVLVHTCSALLFIIIKITEHNSWRPDFFLRNLILPYKLFFKVHVELDNNYVSMSGNCGPSRSAIEMSKFGYQRDNISEGQGSLANLAEIYLHILTT